MDDELAPRNDRRQLVLGGLKRNMGWEDKNSKHTPNARNAENIEHQTHHIFFSVAAPPETQLHRRTIFFSSQPQLHHKPVSIFLSLNLHEFAFG
jgi:hypothetical protein